MTLRPGLYRASAGQGQLEDRRPSRDSGHSEPRGSAEPRSPTPLSTRHRVRYRARPRVRPSTARGGSDRTRGRALPRPGRRPPGSSMGGASCEGVELDRKAFSTSWTGTLQGEPTAMDGQPRCNREPLTREQRSITTWPRVARKVRAPKGRQRLHRRSRSHPRRVLGSWRRGSRSLDGADRSRQASLEALQALPSRRSLPRRGERRGAWPEPWPCRRASAGRVPERARAVTERSLQLPCKGRILKRSKRTQCSASFGP